MTGCPMAYVNPCSECARYGSCAPSQSVQKLENLEKEINELKQLLKAKIFAEK